MGLYDEDYMPDQDEEIIEPKIKKGKGRLPKIRKINFSKKMQTYLIGVLIALIVLTCFYAIYLYVSPSFVKVKFADNPLVLSEQTTTQMQVILSNNTKETLKNLSVTVTPYDNTALVVIPSETQELPVLGPHEKRILTYDLSVAGEVLPGDYSIEVKVKNSKVNFVTYKTIKISKK